MPCWGIAVNYGAMSRIRARISKELINKGLMAGSNKFNEVLSRKVTGAYRRGLLA